MIPLSYLSRHKATNQSHNSFIFLVRVKSHNRVHHTHLKTTIDDDTTDGCTKPVIQTHNTRGGDRLLDTVTDTVESLLSSTNIRGETGTWRDEIF